MEETFATLREFKLRLNPLKFVLGVSKGKFLGFMLTSEGIKVNPDKVKVILEMQ